MGAWTNLNSSGWLTASATAATDAVFTISSNNTWPVSYHSGITPLSTIGDLRKLAETARKWAEELAEKSPNFTGNLQGMCALASRKLHKDLKESKIKAKLAYLNNSCYQHVFLIVPGKKSGSSEVAFSEDQIVDIGCSIYGEDDVCIFDITKHDPVSQPWWSYEQAYSSESGLISRQKKDKWPACQITFLAAKTKQTKLEFVMVGKTDVERGLVRIKPFDTDAVKFFKQQGSGGGP